MTGRIRLALALTFFLPLSTFAADWATWRGPENNGVSREKNLPGDLKNPLWHRKDVSCRSAPIVMNDRVYVIGKVGDDANEQERVICLDAKTGKDVWEHRFGLFFTPIVSVRLGWTVPVGDPETGNVYAHGTQGLLYCFDGATGKIKWEKSLTEQLGRITGYGGRVTSPVIDGNLLIISMISSNWGAQGGGGCRFFAFDKNTGEIVWWNSTGFRPSNTYACVPAVTTMNGQRLVISGGGDGRMHAFQVHTGKKVWSYEFGIGAVNPSPVVDGNLIYCAHGEEIPGKATVGRLVCLDGSKIVNGEPTVVWDIDGIEFKHSSPMLHSDKLYLPDRQGRLYCYEAKTGKLIWRAKFGKNCTGSPTYGDGKIYLSSTFGYWHILDAENKGKRLARERYNRPGFDVEVPGSAAIANGCAYLGTTADLICVGKYAPAEVAVPALPKDPGPNPEGKPAQLQVVPAEVDLNGGESVAFKAKLFDENGRFIKDAEGVKYALGAMKPGPGIVKGAKLPVLEGKLDGAKLTVPGKSNGQSGTVTATAGDLTAVSRVRQIPSLPLTEDFESMAVGTVPGGWTNTQLRFVVEDLKGNKVLAKTAVIAVPFYRKWYAFVGSPEMKGHTIEVDAMGEQIPGNLPDMGVTSHRYILQLMGNNQTLRLSAWDAVPRIAKQVPFKWKAGEWYHFKMKVEQNNGQAVVLGKVWPKGAPEPADWSIEMKDPTPNTSGAPGLYGVAQGINPPAPGTKIYYDNVSIK